MVRANEPQVRSWLPRSWHFLPITMFVTLLCNFGLSGQVPPWPALIAFVLSVAGSFLLAPARKLERASQLSKRLLIVALAVGLPLSMFGLGMALWSREGDLISDGTMAALICVGTVASVYCRRQPGMIFAANLALWSPSIVLAQSTVGLFAVLFGLLVAIKTTREQMSMEREDEERRHARDRAQTRARDILADYEETRQGWFWETDRRSQLTYISAPVAKSLGRKAETLIGKPLTQLFDLDKTQQEGERTLLFHLSARSAFQELPVRAAIYGEERWWSISGRPVHDEFDNFVGFRGSGTDLTEKKRSQEHASRLAHYDSLTGLANRFQMSQSLEKILSSPQEMNRCCAVLLLDLDRFKHVNDTMGHPAGDTLLRLVSQRLERTVDNLGRVGRLGGDEFQVIVPNSIDRTQLGDLAESIIHSLSHPYSIDGQSVVIGASLGIARSPLDGTSSEELIRNADLALYAAKDRGRGRYHFYAEDLHADAEERAQMEKDLRDAIARGHLELYYQPVVSTAEERISGFEALMRWNHPDKGAIAPDKFVAIAEESGLIEQMGEWAIRTACGDLAKWPEDVRCAVNVSPLQFASPNLPTVVANAIAQAGIRPDRLELEITESVFLGDDEATDAMFAALKEVGVRLALDDFGTGYSSLGYLKKAPFDKIKIDQSFVRGATQPDSRNGAIIASITSLAHALGMDTTAEGVETLDELDLVRMHGCSHIQGYIYERPLSSDAATARLETGLAAVAQGPRSARSPRRTTLRKVLIDHHGQIYNGTIRNISATGALIEGLWNVPNGTIFCVQLGEDKSVTATTRWCAGDRMGVEFAEPLARDGNGQMLGLRSAASHGSGVRMRKAG